MFIKTFKCDIRRAMRKSNILLQIGKATKSSDRDLTCNVIRLGGAVAHVEINNHSGILSLKIRLDDRLADDL